MNLTEAELKEKQGEIYEIRRMLQSKGWMALAGFLAAKRIQIESVGKEAARKSENKDAALTAWARLDGFDEAASLAVQVVETADREDSFKMAELARPPMGD